MKAYQEQFPRAAMCEVLEISRSGYYKGRGERVGPRIEQDGELRSHIVRIHEESRGHYGSPRVLLALRKEGHRCGRKRVARLMRQEGLEGVRQGRRRVRTTDSNHAHHASPNLIKGMVAGRLNQIWVSDITYLCAGEEGWVYLATVLDLCSRKIVGWSMARTLEATVVIGALNQALETRSPPPGLIVHSDRGVQYACGRYRELLAEHGIAQSMSAKANCYDNATMESFFGTFKAEQGARYLDGCSARLATFDYIETYYNRSRIHTSLGDCSPDEFEAEFSSGMRCSSGGREGSLEPEDRPGPPDSHDRESHHADYPLNGCSPAEPPSVSPACNQVDPEFNLAQSKLLN